MTNTYSTKHSQSAVFGMRPHPAFSVHQCFLLLHADQCDALGKVSYLSLLDNDG